MVYMSIIATVVLSRKTQGELMPLTGGQKLGANDKITTDVWKKNLPKLLEARGSEGQEAKTIGVSAASPAEENGFLTKAKHALFNEYQRIA